jgi:prevent-host-death family protein
VHSELRYRHSVRETIKQSELRNQNADVMRRVAQGASFTITVNGIPVADLVPHQQEQRATFMDATEMDRVLERLPPVDVTAWLRDQREIDQLLDDDRLGERQEDEHR